MNVKMKVLDYPMLLKLNQSSLSAGRKQHIPLELLSSNIRGQYVVNFHIDHKVGHQEDVRLSVILRPGALSAWLDVSVQEFAAIPDVELTELEWEAAVCVGMPRWEQ